MVQKKSRRRIKGDGMSSQQQYDYQRAMMNQHAAAMNNSGNWLGARQPIITSKPLSSDSLKGDWINAQEIADKLKAQYEAKLASEPMQGPTPAQCKQFPSLQEAWDALKICMKLCGVDKK